MAACITPSTSDSWAAPGTPHKILKWLGQEDAPMLLRLRALPGMLRWGLRFLRECRGVTLARQHAGHPRAGRASLEALDRLAAEHSLAFDRNPPGLIKLFRDSLSMESAVRASRALPGARLSSAAAGRDRRAEEPALAPIRGRIAGGILYPADESGDAHGFVLSLASICEAAASIFRRSVVRARDSTSAGRSGASRPRGSIAGDAFVLAAGPRAPRSRGSSVSGCRSIRPRAIRSPCATRLEPGAAPSDRR